MTIFKTHIYILSQVNAHHGFFNNDLSECFISQTTLKTLSMELVQKIVKTIYLDFKKNQDYNQLRIYTLIIILIILIIV